MIIIMAAGARPEQIDEVIKSLEARGYGIHLSKGVARTIIGAIGALDEEKTLVASQLLALPAVENVVPILKPYKLASREFQPAPTVIDVKGVKIGGEKIVVMAGPCSVESPEQILETARAVKAAGATILRGGAYKPSTSPYSFRGLEKEALEMLKEASAQTGLPVITEVTDPRDVELVCEYADILQIGTRNMTNFMLLQEVGKARKPVMLKRGMSAKIEEWLSAADYILLGGNRQVILCERGIRTFETFTRFTLDINAIPSIKGLSHLPLIADPSHGTGKWDLVSAVAKAAIAAGADGVMVEVHPNPEKALKDGAQSLRPHDFAALMKDLKNIALAVGRGI
jgi:3-deoxy-7-phosphoheptulonate synthase